mgnify:CR=1 FL=1
MGLRGPKPWEPTDEEVAKVRLYAGLGATQEMIASLIGKSVDTLTRNAKTSEALTVGKSETIMKVAGALVRKALSGDGPSAMFYLKTQGGWRETNRTEVTGPDGSPLAINQRVSLKDAPEEVLAYLSGQALPDET